MKRFSFLLEHGYPGATNRIQSAVAIGNDILYTIQALIFTLLEVD